MDVLTSFPAYFIDFVHHYTQIQLIQVVVIALFFGVATGTIAGVIVVPILAAIVEIAADAVVPALLHHASIVVPVFDLALLKKGIALYVVFLAAILVVFAIKKAILAIRG